MQLLLSVMSHVPLKLSQHAPIADVASAARGPASTASAIAITQPITPTRQHPSFDFDDIAQAPNSTTLPMSRCTHPPTITMAAAAPHAFKPKTSCRAARVNQISLSPASLFSASAHSAKTYVTPAASLLGAFPPHLRPM